MGEVSDDELYIHIRFKFQWNCVIVWRAFDMSLWASIKCHIKKIHEKLIDAVSDISMN